MNSDLTKYAIIDTQNFQFESGSKKKNSNSFVGRVFSSFAVTPHTQQQSSSKLPPSALPLPKTPQWKTSNFLPDHMLDTNMEINLESTRYENDKERFKKSQFFGTSQNFEENKMIFGNDKGSQKNAKKCWSQLREIIQPQVQDLCITNSLQKQKNCQNKETKNLSQVSYDLEKKINQLIESQSPNQLMQAFVDMKELDEGLENFVFTKNQCLLRIDAASASLQKRQFNTSGMKSELNKPRLAVFNKIDLDLGRKSFQSPTISSLGNDSALDKPQTPYHISEQFQSKYLVAQFNQVSKQKKLKIKQKEDVQMNDLLQIISAPETYKKQKLLSPPPFIKIDCVKAEEPAQKRKSVLNGKLIFGSSPMSSRNKRMQFNQDTCRSQNSSESKSVKSHQSNILNKLRHYSKRKISQQQQHVEQASMLQFMTNLLKQQPQQQQSIQQSPKKQNPLPEIIKRQKLEVIPEATKSVVIPSIGRVQVLKIQKIQRVLSNKLHSHVMIPHITTLLSNDDFQSPETPKLQSNSSEIM